MKRVASLYLPNWPINRLRRAERAYSRAVDASDAYHALGRVAAVDRAAQCSVPNEGGWRPGARWARAGVEAAIESLPAHQRPPLRELGRSSEAADNPFRKPGRAMRPEDAFAHPSAWADQTEVTARIAALPPHQRPPLRELSRRTEQADHPFRAMPPDEARPSLAQFALMPAVQFPGEGPHDDDHGRATPAGHYGEGRFFQTSRTMGSLVARVCPEQPAAAPRRTVRHSAPPLVTAHKVGGRVEIAAVCSVAAALGLAPGMALTQARAQVSGLDVREADGDGDAADLHRLAVLLARRWTPIVAVSGEDGLLLDLTGVSHLHGGEARMARRLVRLLARHGVRAQVAIADTPAAAWAMARFGLAREGGIDVSITPPGAHAAALAGLPVASLRLDPPALELLARLGVDSISQLLALPRAPLVRRFGRAIVTRLDQAIGRAPEPLVPIVPPVAITVMQRFAEPIATADAIAHWLGELLPRLARALAEAGEGARAVELVAARVDGVPQRLRLGFARPTRDAAHMLRLALRRIEEIAPGYGIDALTLHVRRADPLGPEPLSRQLAEAAAPDLAPLIDALANRIGADRLWRMGPLESDVPERSVTSLPPLDPPTGSTPLLRPDDVRRLDSRTPDHPWHPRWPRPVRLLRRPEPVEHVMAELPDQPLRRFTWRGTIHRVVRADGPERIAGEWWHRSAERQAVRDYFQVEDEAGQRFWLYRRGDGVRLETGDLRWFLHGRFG